MNIDELKTAMHDNTPVWKGGRRGFIVELITGPDPQRRDVIEMCHKLVVLFPTASGGSAPLHVEPEELTLDAAQ